MLSPQCNFCLNAVRVRCIAISIRTAGRAGGIFNRLDAPAEQTDQEAEDTEHHRHASQQKKQGQEREHAKTKTTAAGKAARSKPCLCTLWMKHEKVPGRCSTMPQRTAFHPPPNGLACTRPSGSSLCRPGLFRSKPVWGLTKLRKTVGPQVKNFQAPSLSDKHATHVHNSRNKHCEAVTHAGKKSTNPEDAGTKPCSLRHVREKQKA